MALILILSPINASELDSNQTSDDSSTILGISNDNSTNDIYGGNTHEYGGGEKDDDDDDYYDFHDDPSMTNFVSGVFYGPYYEPALQINLFEIKAGEVTANNYVTINITFDGRIYANIFTLERYPLKIRENDITIGKLTSENMTNIYNPTDPSQMVQEYSFNATFKYKLKENTTELNIRFCGFLSNTLVFNKITAPQLIN